MDPPTRTHARRRVPPAGLGPHLSASAHGPSAPAAAVPGARRPTGGRGPRCPVAPRTGPQAYLLRRPPRRRRARGRRKRWGSRRRPAGDALVKTMNEKPAARLLRVAAPLWAELRRHRALPSASAAPPARPPARPSRSPPKQRLPPRLTISSALFNVKMHTRSAPSPPSASPGRLAGPPFVRAPRPPRHPGGHSPPRGPAEPGHGGGPAPTCARGPAGPGSCAYKWVALQEPLNLGSHVFVGELSALCSASPGLGGWGGGQMK